jgi:hypothetical protein
MIEQEDVLHGAGVVGGAVAVLMSVVGIIFCVHTLLAGILVAVFMGNVLMPQGICTHTYERL